VLVLLVLCVAGALHWIDFSSFPPGMWYDEAYTLRRAQQLAQGGAFRLYYPEKHGEPAMFWLTALALRLGAGPLAARWIASISGVLSVLLLFFAVRDILDSYWIALGSILALSFNYAHLFYTRMAWEQALATLFFIPAIWLFWRALRSGRVLDFIVAGLLTGASQYTSVNARMLPLSMLLITLGWLATVFDPDREDGWRTAWARWRAGLLAMVLAAALIYVPLGLAFLRNPDWFTRRMAASADSIAWLPNLWRALGGWLWRGGAGLHALPGRPIYDPAMGMLLLLGLGVALWRWRRPAYNLWLAWFLSLLPGSLLSYPTPVFYRVLPAVPATVVLSALGAKQIWDWLTPRLSRTFVAGLLLALVAFSAGSTVYDYFVRWADAVRMLSVMDLGKWRAAEMILQHSADAPLYVTIPDGLEPAISYSLHERDGAVRAFDGQRCLRYPARVGQPIDYLVIQGYERRSLSRLQTLFPTGETRIDPVFRDFEPYFVTYTIPAGVSVPIIGALPTPVDYGRIELWGAARSADQLRPGQTLIVTLTWRATAPVDRSYTSFIHLLDQGDDADPLRVQDDGIPCRGTLPTQRWLTDEFVVEERILELPEMLPPDVYLMGVGLYDSSTLDRLVPENVAVRWDEVILGQLSVVDE
jgi:hypothetical protein